MIFHMIEKDETSPCSASDENGTGLGASEWGIVKIPGEPYKVQEFLLAPNYDQRDLNYRREDLPPPTPGRP
jgi:hypothetical protein